MPSVGIFSPGRTRIRSPGWTSEMSTSTSIRSRTTRAFLAPSSMSERIACPARALERCSKYLPSSRNVMMTAAVSK